MAAQILVENDATKRDELIAQAFTIVHEDVSHIPLHQQALAWGVAENVDVVQRADDQFHYRWVVKK